MLACDMAIVLLPDLALRISADKLLSASIRVSFYYLVSIWRSARDLRRQQAQGVPKACKKAGFAPTGAVCRSCTTMPVHSRASPTRRERRNAFPGSEVFGTGTLPVWFQGRSALVAPRGAKSPFRKLVHGVYYSILNRLTSKTFQTARILQPDIRISAKQ